MSSTELCWHARVWAGGHRPIYIIVMSSNNDKRHRVEALDAGADDFIGKPPDRDELFARLRLAECFTFMQGELIRQAETDLLTGLLNRGAFFGRATGNCGDNGQPLSVIILDLEHFKSINDLHGHATGNNVLRGLAGKLAILDAIVGRLGGEEFAICMEGTGGLMRYRPDLPLPPYRFDDFLEGSHQMQV